MNIEMPDLQEKEKAIEAIVAKGLTPPQSLWEHLGGIYRSLGLRFIFWDTAEALVMAVFMSLSTLWLLLSQAQTLYSTLFAASPMLFAFILLFTVGVERAGGIYELKMTCKYTIRQITAFHVVCFSLLGVVFCVIAAAIVNCRTDKGEFFHMLSLSLAALFICAFFTMFITRLFNGRWVFAVGATLWIAANFLARYLFGQHWENFLSGLPFVIALLIALAMCALFLWEIKKFMEENKEAPCYVNS